MFIPRLFRSSTGFLLNDINNILVLINSASSALFYARFSSRQFDGAFFYVKPDFLLFFLAYFCHVSNLVFDVLFCVWSLFEVLKSSSYFLFFCSYRAHLISLLRNFKFLDCLLPPPKVSSFGGAETPSCVFSGIGLRQQNSCNINRQKMSSTFLTVASCNNNNDYGGGGVTKQKRLRANSANPCPL
ncbi:unnamed protein product [Meloidogyne enterolobii]|uniref:Uncharacterized protein n=1 Tax=Meloidogyne enterolobii TaxID=390850 RepID=A0ACB0XMH5_MELEN